MITDEQIEAALSYLALDPHPLVTAEWELAKAKLEREREFAKQYMTIKGTVGEREANIETDPYYSVLRFDEIKAAREVGVERARLKKCETVIEMWRTLQANARQAERVR